MKQLMSSLLGVCLLGTSAYADLQSAAKANNKFGLNLYQSIRKAEAKSVANRFVSPVSAYLAISMLANGARNSTHEAILKTIEQSGLSNEELNRDNKELMKELIRKKESENDTELSLANSSWVDKRFQLRSHYIDTIKSSYNAEARELDFSDPSSADKINAWVEKNTNGKIKKLIENTNGESFYLINTTYFKASWSHPFNPKLTKNEIFHVSNDATKSVPMMHGENVGGYVKANGYEAIALNYGYGDSRMIILLPRKDISTLENSLTDVELSSLSEALTLEKNKHEVDLKMPKFKFDYKADLIEPLENLGMSIAFSNLADFFDMASGGVFVSKALQKTFLSVDEVGTEAAAATVIGGPTSMPPTYPKASLNLNRPFFVVIEDTKTRSQLFLGSIVNP